MAHDGYRPAVSIEEPIEEHEAYNALASKLGIDDYHRDMESGIDPETIVVFGHIPAKYIKKIR